MRTTLEPDTIYRKILQNHIKMEEGIEKLILIIEKSDNNITRLESLNILNKLNIQDHILFKTLENCLISDESEEIRIISAKNILRNYLDSGTKCLEWAILEDKSPKLLSILGKTLRSSKIYQYRILYQTYLQRLEKISEEIDVNTAEVPFLLDIEFNLSSYNALIWNKSDRLIFDEIIMFQLQRQHISELNVSLRDTLPSSINLLKNLKNLNLSCNNLTELPDTLTELTNLESIDLSWNDFAEFPAVLNKLKSIKEIKFHHNLSQS
jgi:Leucine-rich repeat (LRR) protein